MVVARLLLAGAVVAAAAMGVTASHAQSPPAPVLDRDAVGAIVREYLLAHPEVIEEAVQVLRARREREQLRRARAAIAQHTGALLAHPMSPAPEPVPLRASRSPRASAPAAPPAEGAS